MNAECPAHLRVATAVIERQGRYLITQRNPTSPLGGLWEFPSVVVKANESDEATLRREIRERLGIDVQFARPAAHRTQSYCEHVMDYFLYRATIPATQDAQTHNVADLRWVSPEELENYRFPSSEQAAAQLLVDLRKRDRHDTKATLTRVAQAAA